MANLLKKYGVIFDSIFLRPTVEIEILCREIENMRLEKGFRTSDLSLGVTSWYLYSCGVPSMSSSVLMKRKTFSRIVILRTFILFFSEIN